MSTRARESAVATIAAVRNELGKVKLADLPTPVHRHRIEVDGRRTEIHVKRDDLTGDVYGGNKLRKLEYLLQRVRRRDHRLVGTFGTAASNHALATAICCRRLGLPCICFLSHQRVTPTAGRVLNMHAKLGTQLVPFGGEYAERLRILREHLWNRQAGVIPPGGSSWIGTVGYVEAAVELATQVAEGALPEPHRVYVATGTMGTAAGLALGFTLAGLGTEVHAIRVSHTWLCNEVALARLLGKTAAMLHRAVPAFPENLDDAVRLRLRHEFFAGGYAATDDATEEAIRLARDQLGLALEGTYTGKAMAALVADLRAGEAPAHVLFWNTCNGRVLPVPARAPLPGASFPEAFQRYFPAA
ncbi:MAG TPA: pyridoxal-phosphate dependent enzyme [Woeseiaceae bacterium]|nr:pyridoxal-phosphate dependent enzyme [Woeseiaceae bacterium]